MWYSTPGSLRNSQPSTPGASCVGSWEPGGPGQPLLPSSFACHGVPQDRGCGQGETQAGAGEHRGSGDMDGDRGSALQTLEMLPSRQEVVPPLSQGVGGEGRWGASRDHPQLRGLARRLAGLGGGLCARVQGAVQLCTAAFQGWEGAVRRNPGADSFRSLGNSRKVSQNVLFPQQGSVETRGVFLQGSALETPCLGWVGHVGMLPGTPKIQAPSRKAGVRHEPRGLCQQCRHRAPRSVRKSFSSG